MRVQLLKPPRPRYDHGTDEGAVAVIVAILASVLLVLAAFAVDIGNAYAQGRQISVAMDAAALSAAAKVGDLMPRNQACTPDVLASINAQQVAQAEADRINTENRKNGLPEAVDSVTVSCEDSGKAVQVDVKNNRGVPTSLGRIIGIDSISPGNYAAARYVRMKVASGLRPWAVCDGTALLAQQNPTTTYVAPLDNKLGVCSSQASGNWGSVDFNGQTGGNGAGDLADWTLDGYPGPVEIPSVLPADPGVSASNPLMEAFAALVNQVVLFPTTTGYLPGGGNNGSFDAVGIITVKVCGFYYQGTAYNNGSDCWVDPVEGTRTPNPPTTQTATGGTIARNSDVLTISATSPVTFTADMANNPDVVVTIPGAGQAGAPLVTRIKTYTSPTSVVLVDKASRAVTAPGVNVTIATTTYTTAPGVPVGIEFQGPVNNRKPMNHIQFQWRNYTTSSYTGSDADTCALDDPMCVGQAILWK